MVLTDNEVTNKYPCDIKYKCECGEYFTLITSITGHRYLPNSFETQPPSEQRQVVNEMIDETKLNPSAGLLM